MNHTSSLAGERNHKRVRLPNTLAHRLSTFLMLPMLLLADALIATACESAPPSNASQDNADTGAHADANSNDRASAVPTGSL